MNYPSLASQSLASQLQNCHYGSGNLAIALCRLTHAGPLGKAKLFVLLSICFPQGLRSYDNYRLCSCNPQR